MKIVLGRRTWSAVDVKSVEPRVLLTHGRLAHNQDLFTVVPSEEYNPSYNTAGLRCRSPTIQGAWVPEPEKMLDVKLEGPSGAVSEIGWPACCMSLPFPFFPTLRSA